MLLSRRIYHNANTARQGSNYINDQRADFCHMILIRSHPFGEDIRADDVAHIGDVNMCVCAVILLTVKLKVVRLVPLSVLSKKNHLSS
jgi:hypothetical protein